MTSRKSLKNWMCFQKDPVIESTWRSHQCLWKVRVGSELSYIYLRLICCVGGTVVGVGAPSQYRFTWVDLWQPGCITVSSGRTLLMVRQLQSQFCCPVLDQLITAACCRILWWSQDSARMQTLVWFLRYCSISLCPLFNFTVTKHYQSHQAPRFLDYCAFLWGRPDDTRVSAPQSALAETDGNFISAAAAAAAALQPMKHSTTFTGSIFQKQKNNLNVSWNIPAAIPQGRQSTLWWTNSWMKPSLLIEGNLLEGHSVPGCIFVNIGHAFLLWSKKCRKINSP